MVKRTFQLLLVGCLVTGTLLAATDPFVGKWRLDSSKSHIAGDVLKIEAHAGNKYTLTFGNISDTLVADGTDQPVHFGRTESLKQEGPNVWKAIVKQDGRVLSTSIWTLSSDGKTLNDDISGTRPDGSAFHFQIVARRRAGTSGLAGTWERMSTKIESPEEWVIKPYDGNGLSFISPAEKESLSMKFDGKDYPNTGPNVPAGTVSSGRRINQRTLEVTDKVKGKVMDTVRYQISPDQKTMTLIVHGAGQKNPITIVYDRQ